MIKRKGCFAVHSYGGRWIFLLTLMLFVFSPHVDGQTGRFVLAGHSLKADATKKP